MKLIDGPLAGHEAVERPHASHVVYPSVDGDGQHFVSHHYTVDGRWLHSETFVGYESDEKIARRIADDEWMYWNDIQSASERSFS